MCKNCTFSVPSPYQVRSFLAPCLHQPCTEYARQSGSLCSEHAGFTYHQPAESGAVVPALERTKSEQRAIKGRKTGNVITMLVVAGFWFGEVFFDKNDFSPRKIFAMRYWVVPPAFLKDKS